MPVDPSIRPEPGSNLWRAWLAAGGPPLGSDAYQAFLKATFPDTPASRPRLVWQGVVYEAVGDVADEEEAADGAITDGDQILVAKTSTTVHGGRRVEAGEPIPSAPAFEESTTRIEVRLSTLGAEELLARDLARWKRRSEDEGSS